MNAEPSSPPPSPVGQQVGGINVKRLDSGYWLIRGYGPCNWAQPPHWPCSEHVLRQHAFLEASEPFIREAMGATP